MRWRVRGRLSRQADLAPLPAAPPRLHPPSVQSRLRPIPPGRVSPTTPQANRELEAEEVSIVETRARTDAIVQATADPDERATLQDLADGVEGDDGDDAAGAAGRRPDASVEELERRAQAYDAEHEASVRLLDRIKPGVHSLFQKVGAADEAAMESLAATGVSDSNILVFLGVVESRISEIVRLQRSLGIAAPPLPVASFSPRAVEAAAAAGPAKQPAGDGRLQLDGGYRSELGMPPGRSASVAALLSANMPSGPVVRRPEPPSMGDAPGSRQGSARGTAQGAGPTGGPVAPSMPASAPESSNSPSSSSPPAGGMQARLGGPRASRARLTATSSFRGRSTAHRPQFGENPASSQQRRGDAGASSGDPPSPIGPGGATAGAGGRGAPIKGMVLDVSALKRQLGLAPRPPTDGASRGRPTGPMPAV